MENTFDYRVMFSHRVSPYSANLSLTVGKHILNEGPTLLGLLSYLSRWPFLLGHQSGYREGTDNYYTSQVRECSYAQLELLLVKERSCLVRRRETIVHDKDGWSATHELILGLRVYCPGEPISLR